MRKRFDPVLAAITVAGAIGGALLVVRVRNWAVMPDELLYVDMARSIARTGFPVSELRGETISVYQLLFPTIIAPIVGLLSMPNAYPVIAVVNAGLFALTAIPAYLLAHFATGSRAAARWVALTTIVVVWLSFTSKVMPDAVSYLTFTVAAYAIARTAIASEKASALKPDLLTLLAIALAYASRNQFIVLVAAWIAVIGWCAAAQAVSDRSAKPILETIKRRPVPIVAFVVVAAIVLIKPGWLLGVYAASATGTRGGVAPTGLLGSVADHISVLALGLAGLPLVLGLPWVLTALTRTKERAQLSAAAAIAILTLIIVFVGANFDTRYGQSDRVIERYIFYAAPLLLAAMAGFFVKPPKNLIAFALPAIAGILLIGASQPYGQDNALNVAINQAFSPLQIGLIVYQKVADAIGISIYALFLLLMILGGAGAWIATQKHRNAAALNVAFAATAAVILVVTLYTVPKVTATQTDKANGNVSAQEKTWLDRAVGDDKASLVYSPLTDVAAIRGGKLGAQFADSRVLVNEWWNLQFWNGQLTSIYAVGPDNPKLTRQWFGPAHKLIPDWNTGALARTSVDDATWMVLAKSDPRFAPFASEVLTQGAFTLYETGDNPTAEWATRGLTFHGWIPPKGALLRAWSSPGATRKERVAVTVVTASTKSAKTRSTRFQAVINPGKSATWVLSRGRTDTHVERITIQRE